MYIAHECHGLNGIRLTRFNFHDEVKSRGGLPMPIKSHASRDALVASKRYSEAQEMPQVIDQILESPIILVPRSPQTFLNIVADFPHFRHVCLEKLAKALPWRVRT